MTRADPRRAALLAATLLAATGARGQDAPVGPPQARTCVLCHGPIGMATAPETPNLAGQPASYLTAQLKAFRGGTRRHEVMSVIAKSLSDDDIKQLAGWFSSIRVEAKPP